MAWKLGDLTRACAITGGAYGFGLATLGRVNLELDQVAGLVAADHLGTSLEVDALLLQDLLGLLGNLGVHARATDLVEELNHGDVRAKTGPDRSHLQTNDTTTNHEHLSGNLVQGNGARAGDDTLLIDLEAREGGSLATSRNDDVLGNNGSLAAVVQFHLDGVFVLERASALDVLDAILLEQELNTLRQASNGLILGLHKLLEVQLDVANFNSAVLGIVKDLVVKM